jgi:UDPglucose 6-dehydrogenase
MANIAVIGAGYVGLTTAACLAHLGHDVVCADIDQAKIDLLNAGRIPIREEGLEEIVVNELDSGRLRFVLGAANACADADYHYLCVPTPSGPDGAADLTYLEAAAAEIGPVLRPGSVIVNKSTVPVGTTTVVDDIIRRDDISVVSNPEFLREGTAVHDFLHPDRVVIGGSDHDAAVRVSGLYSKLAAPIVICDAVSAELIKYASNAFLATKLTFVNEMANLCEKVGADIDDVMLGMGYDARIGRSFLKPGPGWGGSCFPKDTAAMVRIAADAGAELDFIERVIALNDRHFDRIVDKVRDIAGRPLDQVTVAAWGITFKAGTDDRRSSPAIEVIGRLVERGATVVAHDPTVTDPIPELPGVTIAPDPYAAADGADVVVVLTEWSDYRWLDYAKVADAMATPLLVDARNLLDRSTLVRHGFTTIGVGK